MTNNESPEVPEILAGLILAQSVAVDPNNPFLTEQTLQYIYDRSPMEAPNGEKIVPFVLTLAPDADMTSDVVKAMKAKAPHLRLRYVPPNGARGAQIKSWRVNPDKVQAKRGRKPRNATPQN